MLETRNLSHFYKSEQRFSFPDLNCNVQETLLILGPSGVGKTTLLHILAGILHPKEGKVVVQGESIYDRPSKALDQLRGNNIGIVFQKPHFIAALTAIDNLRMAQKLAGQKVDEKKILKLLDQLNITSKKDSLTNSMSQGELQRLSIARALINDPKVILADEPTSALDDYNCDEVIKLLSLQAEQHKAALIIVTHDNRLKSLFDNQIELS